MRQPELNTRDPRAWDVKVPTLYARNSSSLIYERSMYILCENKYVTIWITECVNSNERCLIGGEDSVSLVLQSEDCRHRFLNGAEESE